MTETVRERTRITGSEMLQLIDRRHAILKDGWRLHEQSEASTEQLERLIGVQAILGEAYSSRRLSPETRALIRQRGDIVARLIFNRAQAHLMDADTERSLTEILCPEGAEPAILTVTPHSGNKEHIVWWDPKPGEDSLKGTFDRMSGFGSFWMNDESDNGYLVKAFDDSNDRNPQVDIEIMYR